MTKPSKKPAAKKSPARPKPGQKQEDTPGPDLTFPQRVRITGPEHPWHGKEGWLTGDTATPPGAAQPMHKVVWDQDGEAGCYALTSDVTLIGAKGARATLPSKREAKARAKRKTQPRVTNGGSVGNSMTVAPEAEPHDSSAHEYTRGPYAKASTPTCGARRNKSPDDLCKRPAGWGTDHPGVGRCKLHGGLTPAPTGRYASVERPRVRELLEKFEADPDPLNLLSEVSLLRALLLDYINRYETQDQMLTRWNLSFEKSFQADWSTWWRELRADAMEREDDLSEELLAEMPDPMEYLPSKPLRMGDITEVSGLVNQVGAMVERIRKAQSTATFTMDTINVLWRVMGGHITDAALEEIKDDDIRSALLAAVERRFATISLAELASRRAAD